MSLCLTTVSSGAEAPTQEGRALRDALVREAAEPGKPAWRPMLLYLAELHGRSVHPPMGHFRFPFEDIGPGYPGGRAFGHIDLAHQRLDSVRALPEQVRNQTHNKLAGQQPDGLIPGVIEFDTAGKASWKPDKSFPPLWVAAVDACFEITSDTNFLAECLEALRKQIGWFESMRAVPGGGFYYLDVLRRPWESGMDEGIRYDQRPPAPAPAVDASAHIFMLYEHAAQWSRQVGQPHVVWENKAKALQQFIQRELWDAESGFFYDHLTVHHPDCRHLAFEGMWPMVTGAATRAQAARVINEHLLNPKGFFAAHPISTVGLCDPKFELRM